MGEGPVGPGDRDTVHRVFDLMPLMVVLFGGVDLRVAASTAAFRGLLGRPDLLGSPPVEAFPGPAGRQTVEVLETVRLTGHAAVLRELRIERGGEVAFVDVAAGPHWDPVEARTDVLCQVVDVTTRVHARGSGAASASDAELQQALLPAGLPVLPDLRLAASYLPAGADGAAGGDWFDVVVLPDGLVALVVGDVVGKGLVASAAMGRLRTVLRERLSATGDPVAALAATDAAAQDIPGARAATVCLVLLDRATGTLRYCTAGHPAPVLATSDGDARHLAPSGAGPVGAGRSPAAVPFATEELPPGAVVLLYSDGVLERPGVPAARGTVEWARILADAVVADRVPRTTPLVEWLCTRPVEQLVQGTGHSDDITVLAAQPCEPVPDLRVDTADDPRALAAVRAAFDAWLREIGAAPHDVEALQHAVGELVVNAMEHAHRDDPAPDPAANTISIAGCLSPAGEVRVDVADRGRWREPRSRPGHGIGLEIATSLVDRLDLDKAPAGTVATVRHRLSRPARAPAVGLVPVRPPVLPDSYLCRSLASTTQPRVQVEGPIDALTADLFVPDLGLAGAAGAGRLTVDLTGVSLLASAGVAALLRLTDEHDRNGGELRLYAPTGTTADLILTLVGVEHHTEDPDAF